MPCSEQARAEAGPSGGADRPAARGSQRVPGAGGASPEGPASLGIRCHDQAAAEAGTVMSASRKDTRKADLAKIHIAKKELGMDEETYRNMLWTVALVKSSSELNYEGRQKLLAHLAASASMRSLANRRCRH